MGFVGPVNCSRGERGKASLDSAITDVSGECRGTLSLIRRSFLETEYSHLFAPKGERNSTRKKPMNKNLHCDGLVRAGGATPDGTF